MPQLRTPYWTIALILAITPLIPVAAQDQEAPADAPSSEADESNAALDAARAKGGDLLTLKTGSIMSGVQILRDTPQGYEIQVLEGMAPILLPRKMVVSIEYDDIDPLHEKRKEELFGKDDDVLESGQKLSPELMERLRNPVPGEPITMNETDLVQIVKAIAERSQVTIAIHPSLDGIPPFERRWSVTTSPELPLLQLLQEHLLTKFPNLDIKFELNQLTLMTKEALAQEAPPQETTTP